MRRSQLPSAKRERVTAERYATALLRRVCSVAGSCDLIAEARAELRRRGLQEAVRRHDDGPIFEWLLDNFNFSGVSDAIAASYLERHGSITAEEITASIQSANCPKLLHFGAFRGCGYRKTAATCSEPKRFRRCCVPKHEARNGRLAQSAYSLQLFFRDIAQGDFVGWLDQQLEQGDGQKQRGRGPRLARAIVEPMISIHGVSSKLITMSMSQLLLGTVPRRERWFTAGAHLIAIDRLCHNFLWRTGVLKRFEAEHVYGPSCYREGGCAAIIAAVARRIDARRFNANYPRVFPRFVQHAVWRYCAEGGLNVCNGRMIDDSRRCRNANCMLFESCDRLALRPQTFGRPAA